MGSIPDLDNFSSPKYVLVTACSETDNLLSHGIAVKMGLIQRVDDVSPQDSDIWEDIGRLDCDPVQIRLKLGTASYSILLARCTPIPLLPAMDDELQRMENHGIIESD